MAQISATGDEQTICQGGAIAKSQRHDFAVISAMTAKSGNKLKKYLRSEARRFAINAVRAPCSILD